jgi:hypothetical protein
MVTEYIKRGQKWGYDENGVLLYKIPMDEPSPLVAAPEEVTEEVQDEEEAEEVAPTFPFTVGE